ncbi:MAG: hypothetical protein JO112_04945, partial [Planctomycetes bacterium]|nr:hypothetical protein [Planctomycetota bacterium]
MSMGTLLLSWLCLTTSATPIDVFPINNRNFQIPIHIDPARKTEIKQLVLFYSSDQGKSWQQAMTAAPEKEAFQFYAPSDGLYWFSVVVVDFQGNRTPDDINKAPPAQKILVDTEKPVVRIVSAERQG